MKCARGGAGRKPHSVSAPLKVQRPNKESLRPNASPEQVRKLPTHRQAGYWRLKRAHRTTSFRDAGRAGHHCHPGCIHASASEDNVVIGVGFLHGDSRSNGFGETDRGNEA